MSDPRDPISKVLSPISYDDFFEQILDKKPLIQLGDATGEKANIAGTDPKQSLLDDYEKYSATLTCHSHAPQTPPPTARHVNSAEEFLDLIHQYHELGYTVRIPDVTQLSQQLSEFTRALEKSIGNPVGVVVFWSAPGNAAPVHYDEVDVIVIQLVGTKKWFISEDPSLLPNKWKSTGEGPLPFDRYKTVDVGPGDFIYLPRGTVHTVQSTSESIHLSIGFVPVTVREGINAVLDHLSDSDFGLRQAMAQRSDKLDTQTVSQQIRAGLENLLAKCQSDQFIEMAMRRRRAKMIAELPKLTPVHPQQQLTLNSRVVQNSLAMVELISTEDIVDFCQPGEHILVHKGAEQALEFVANTSEFVVSDLPGGLTPEVQLALVNRLVNSGLLIVE